MNAAQRNLAMTTFARLAVMPEVAAALFYANGRYRAEGDLGVALLAGVGIDVIWGWCGPVLRRAVSARREPRSGR